MGGGLSCLVSVGPNEVEHLDNEEFNLLGVKNIGDRVRLKQACRTFLHGSQDQSPAVKRFIELHDKKRCTKKRETGNKKITRRLYLGWKHRVSKRRSYQLISASKGGGSQTLDFPKDMSREDLLQRVVKVYFPDGFSLAQCLSAVDVTARLTSFSGAEVPYTIDGEPFSIQRYFDSLNCHPVRIYLQTDMRSIDDDDDDDDLPEIRLSSESISNTQRHVTAPSQLTPKDIARDTVPSELAPTIIARDTVPSELAPTDIARDTVPSELAPTDIARDSDSDFEFLDTPTIQINRRCLSLARRVVSTENPAQPVASTSEELPEDNRNEEMELEMAIRASLENTDRPDGTIESILNHWISNTLKQGVSQQILLQRGNILQSTLRAVSRPTFKFELPIKVIFAGEIGDDLGGPKREFLRELMMEVQEDILMGPEGNKVFNHDLQKLFDERYHTAGKLVAFSLLHGGPGLPVLNVSLYKLMTTGEMDKVNQLDQCILDEELKGRIHEIKTTTTQDELMEVVNKDMDWYIDQGVMPHTIKIKEKDQFIENLVKNAIYYRVQTEIVQFQNGLDSIGRLFDAITNAPETMKAILVDLGLKLTFEKFRQLYTVNFSEDGSNQKKAEADTIYCLEAFLLECQGGQLDVTLEGVLSFWTGATNPPPLGFHKKLEIDFVSSDQHLLPVAHTCGLVLELKRGLTDPDQFQEDMTKAILWTGGFHIV